MVVILHPRLIQSPGPPIVSMDVFTEQIAAATAAHLANYPFQVDEPPEFSLRNKCSITASCLFAHFSGSPPAFDQSEALERGIELFYEVVVCPDNPMKVVYVNLEGSGGHRFCILGHRLPDDTDGEQAVYAILQSNADAKIVYLDGPPHIYALGDRLPVVFSAGEFALWWAKLVHAVEQRDAVEVGRLMGMEIMTVSQGCNFTVANCI